MDNNVENNINSEFNGLTAAEVNARIEAGKILRMTVPTEQRER